MGQPGFGSDPQSRRVRVVVGGQASPRWKGVASSSDADRLNERLSIQRSDTARNIVEQVLRRQLPGIIIEPAVSRPAGDSGGGEVELGAYGVGSRDSLVRVGGNRLSNEEVDRSVTISIDLVTTHYGQAGRSLPPGRVPAKTQFWYVKVTHLRVDAIGAAFGEIEFVLRNPLSDKTMTARAELDIGGGVNVGLKPLDAKQLIQRTVTNHLGQSFKDFVGRDEVSISVDREIGFDDFQDEWIRVGSAAASLGLGAEYTYITFPFLGGTAADVNPIRKKIGPSFPKLQGWVVSGRIQLIGKNPGDWFEIDSSDMVPTAYDSVSDGSLIVTFPTGRSDLPPGSPGRVHIEDFVRAWTEKMGAL
jgi:hypothetical protein